VALTTAELWAAQDRHEGDRWRLFSAVAGAVEATEVLYPGSYVDIAPSMVFPSVTYVDVDRRAERFFADRTGVLAIVAAHHGSPLDPQIRFLNADYTTELGLPDQHFDLLVSLYAGFVSEHCTQHLKIGGTLLVNPSHGDAAMAAIDPRYELAGVVRSRSGAYRVETSQLERFLIPKKPGVVTADLLHERGRGIAYTTSPFAYLFRRVA
jgi:hypothetical protein